MESIGCLARLVVAFDAGTPVANIVERSNDAPFILEGNEFELEWREILFPPAALPKALFEHSIDFTELLRHEARVLTLCSPPLILIAPTELQILDGWRRIAVAQIQGAPIISLLVAKVPEIVPT